MSERVEIKRSTRTLFFAVCGGLVFTTLGVCLIVWSFAPAQSHRGDALSAGLVGGVLVVFFGGGALLGLWRFFDNSPGLVFDADGITFDAGPGATTLVPWADVVGAHTSSLQGQEALIVALRDPQKYMNEGNWLRRRIRRMNNRLCGSPIALSAAALRISFADMVETFEEYFTKYGAEAVKGPWR